MDKEPIYFIPGAGFKHTVLMHHALIKYLIEGEPIQSLPDNNIDGWRQPPSNKCVAIVFCNLRDSDEFNFLFHTVLPKRLKRGNTQVSDFAFTWQILYNDYRKGYREGIKNHKQRIDTKLLTPFFGLVEKQMYELDDILIKSYKNI